MADRKRRGVPHKSRGVIVGFADGKADPSVAGKKAVGVAKVRRRGKKPRGTPVTWPREA